VKADIGDVELFFDVEGPYVVPEGAYMRERPSVLLVHTGPGADHSFYKEHVGPALAQVAQVVYLDVRGAGRSDRSTPDRWNLETWAEDVHRFCDAVELDRPVVLGTAFGAIVAVLYAAEHPDGLSKLVLTSAVARASQTRAIEIFDRLGGPEAADVAVRYFSSPTDANFIDFLRVCVPLYTRTPLTPESIARVEMNIELSKHWDAGEALTWDVRGHAPLVRVPTLVLAGEDDPSATIAGTEELVAGLPAELVRFERFAGAGHGVFRDVPAAVELVKDFVRWQPEPDDSDAPEPPQ